MFVIICRTSDKSEIKFCLKYIDSNITSIISIYNATSKINEEEKFGLVFPDFSVEELRHKICPVCTKENSKFSISKRSRRNLRIPGPLVPDQGCTGRLCTTKVGSFLRKHL